jgi:hypothetical protein
VPTTAKALYRGAAVTSNATLYTVPSATTAVVNTIVVVNSAATNATYTLLLDDVPLSTTVVVPANDSAILEIKQALATGKTVKGFASAITVAFHISGIEIT